MIYLSRDNQSESRTVFGIVHNYTKEKDFRTEINTICLIGLARLNGEVILRGWSEEFKKCVYISVSIAIAYQIFDKSRSDKDAYMCNNRRWHGQIQDSW